MKVLCSQEVVRPHRCSCPMSGHCKGVCIPDTMVCALVRGFPREVRRGWQSQKPLIFMHFHEVFLGSQHEIWSKQHNGKVRWLWLTHFFTKGGFGNRGVAQRFQKPLVLLN